MSKHKTSSLPAVTAAAKVASRQLSALNRAAEAIHGKAYENPARSLHIVSTKDGIEALIRTGKLTVQVQNGDFAVSMSD